jgi:tRNA1Val (adenine37-N6)-methyltransferase
MNTYFQFKQFTVHQERCAMKVSTDACLFGAWMAGGGIGQRAMGIGQLALDIGGGTGLLSLMLAQASAFNIDAIELEQECFAQMKNNIDASPWADRIRCLEGDVRNFSFTSRYNFIFSNPPFYEKQLPSPDPSINAAMHSSMLTLKELLQKASLLLHDDGLFAILMPYYRHEELINEALHAGLHAHHISLARHSPKHPWFRTMVIFGKTASSVIETTIDIRDTAGGYSQAFSMLMKEYYLNPSP